MISPLSLTSSVAETSLVPRTVQRSMIKKLRGLMMYAVCYSEEGRSKKAQRGLSVGLGW